MSQSLQALVFFLLLLFRFELILPRTLLLSAWDVVYWSDLLSEQVCQHAVIQAYRPNRRHH